MRLVVPVIINEQEVIDQIDNLGMKECQLRTHLYTFCVVDAIMPHDYFLDMSMLVSNGQHYGVALNYEELDKKLRKAELLIACN